MFAISSLAYIFGKVTEEFGKSLGTDADNIGGVVDFATPHHPQSIRRVSIFQSSNWNKVGSMSGSGRDLCTPSRTAQLPSLLKENLVDQWRMFDPLLAAMDLLISAYTFMVSMQYTGRHNPVCKVPHQNLAHKHGLITEILPVYQY